MDKIKELLTRGVDEVINKGHLEKKLKGKKKLRVKYGIDPTGADIHLGNAISILKLRDFQELGHKIVLIVGDFTGLIGDTSDKESERPMLTEKEVEKNMKTYRGQLGKILDMKKVETHYNSEWFKGLNYLEIGKQADQFSLKEFIVRENIKKRLDKEGRISFRELMYPLMQGYDSVAIKADVEIGGTDQRFNMLAGRRLQKFYKQEPQDIMMVDIIPGIDGRKMSKSYGNTINILDEPKEKFGKVMSIPDELIFVYFEHCTRVPTSEIRKLEKAKNPRDAKMRLAYEIVKMYHGKKDAKKECGQFIKTFSKKEVPKDIPKYKLKGSENIADVLVESKLCSSKSEARRAIEQGGVSLGGKKVKSFEEKVTAGVLKKGKRHFVKIVRV